MQLCVGYLYGVFWLHRLFITFRRSPLIGLPAACMLRTDTIISPCKSNGKRKICHFFEPLFFEQWDTVVVYFSPGSSLIRYLSVSVVCVCECMCVFGAVAVAFLLAIFTFSAPVGRISFFLQLNFIASHRIASLSNFGCALTSEPNWNFALILKPKKKSDAEKGMSRKTNILFILSFFLCFDRRFYNHISRALFLTVFHWTNSGICRWLPMDFCPVYLSDFFCSVYLFSVCECVLCSLYFHRQSIHTHTKERTRAFEHFMKRLSGFRNKWNIDESDVTI